MIYRVTMEVNYSEVRFDFNTACDALVFMDYITNHIVETDKTVKATMEMIKEENPAGGNP